MRNELPSGTTRRRRRRHSPSLVGMMAVFIGAAGPVLLVAVVAWAAINVVRYFIGAE